MSQPLVLISGPEIARYGFPQGHPFGPDRHAAFMTRLEQSPVAASLVRKSARQATREELEYFHTPAYVERVIALSARGIQCPRSDCPKSPLNRKGCAASRPNHFLFESKTAELSSMKILPAGNKFQTRRALRRIS